ncbi:hypothetical protein [Emticicia sp. BO119]|uniref:hypothetical protein n=1 Tax=Emticicia sp. BO119 TaxID=2757768 RepID=UPI0015F11602|nr:hypothetical protein [Emticicia sp. BO119]MBA4852025.1 hypothetical protein [Emticicia sp. BO119]
MIILESNARIIEDPLFIEVPLVNRKFKMYFLESLSRNTFIHLPTYEVLCDLPQDVEGCLVFDVELDDYSMLYAPQTKLLVKKVEIEVWDTIASGVYAVNFNTNQITIKRIRENDLIEKSTLTLYANPDTSGEGSITLKKSDINHIWKAYKMVSAPLPVND